MDFDGWRGEACRRVRRHPPGARGTRGNMIIYTSRVGYQGADALDITAKSASPDGKVFAPPWSLLRRYLPKFSGRPLTAENFAEYEREYLSVLAARRVEWSYYLRQP